MLSFITRHSAHIAIFSLFIFALTSLRLAWDDALVFDEPAHIAAGYSYIATGEYRLNPEHPPLLKVLSGLAIAPFRPSLDTTQPWWMYPNDRGDYDQWIAGRELLSEDVPFFDTLAFFARIPTIIISVFFGALLFVFGRRLSGAPGGLIVLLLYILSPIILGHSHLVTTDIAIAASITLFFMMLFSYITKPTWKNALILGASLGLAQSVKFSGITLLPFLFVIPLIHTLLKNTSLTLLCQLRHLKRSFLHVSLAFFVGILTLWVVYAPFTIRMPQDVLATTAPAIFSSDSSRDILFHNTTLFLNENTLTRPFATYLQGLGRVLNRVDYGNTFYFFGEVSSHAKISYFPILFFMKETVPHIALMFIALALSFIPFVQLLRSPRNLTPARIQHYILAHVREITLISFIIFYAYISITGNLTIGYRHILPIIPLLYLLTGTVIARALKRASLSCHCPRLPITVFILFAIMLVEIISTYPRYISYFNQSVGGPQNGYFYVTDSNTDWGQDSKRLKSYLDNHPEIGTVRVDYFGGDNIFARLGARAVPWQESKRPLETGWYAISANTLQNSSYAPHANIENSYLFLRNKKPFAQIGTSILLYFIDTEPHPDLGPSDKI